MNPQDVAPAVSDGSSIPDVAAAAGDATIKVALVGCGSRATGAAAQALQTKGPITLWAMADPRPQPVRPRDRRACPPGRDRPHYSDAVLLEHGLLARHAAAAARRV